jgi:hypothetical protein
MAVTVENRRQFLHSKWSEINGTPESVAKTYFEEPKIKDYSTLQTCLNPEGVMIAGKDLCRIKIQYALEYSFTLVGETINNPSSEAFQTTISSIIEKYGGYAVEDIIHAFHYSIRKNRDHPNIVRTSMRYVFSVLSDYLVYKCGVVTESIKTRRLIFQSPHALFLSKRVNNASAIRSLILEAYFKFLEGKGGILLFDHYYDYLDDLKLIELSVREKKLVFKKVEIKLYNGDYLPDRPHPYNFNNMDPIVESKKLSIMWQFSKWRKRALSPDDLKTKLNRASWIGLHHLENYKAIHSPLPFSK